MKFPALSIFTHRFLLPAVLVALVGCSWFPKRERTHFGTPTPPPTPIPGSTPPPFAAEDKKFFNTAYRVFVYERKLGSLGKQYANSDDARNLASLMETEMGLAIQDLKTLVDSRKQTMDASEGWGHGGLERLANQKGGDFDRKFYEEVKLSSSDAYIAFDQAFRVTVDGGVKEFAKNWYPILRNYPREAIRLETILNKKRK